MATLLNSFAGNGNTNGGNENWKATAFLNLYVRKPDGSKLKIGAIPLKAQVRKDAALIERLQQEGAVESLKKSLEIDFQMVDNEAMVDVGF